jgi:hypothetical protein
MDSMANITEGLGQPSAVARILAGMPRYIPTPTVQPSHARVFMRDATVAPKDAQYMGDVAPGQTFDIESTPLAGRDVLVGLQSVSPDGTLNPTLLDDLSWQPLNYTPTTATVAGFDAHVPTVTTAPTIAKAENSDEWIVFTPAPDDNGSTLTGCDLHVQKAADATVFDEWMLLAVSSSHRIDQKTYPSKIKYRWRNQSTEDAGNGRGVSAWSPLANAAELGAGTPDPSPSTVLPTYDPDPDDSRAGSGHGVIGT